MQLVGGAIGGMFQAGGQKKAAQINAATTMEMFNRGQEATQPYREAGQVGLTGMQDLMSPEGQAAFMESYKETPMFQNMMDTGTENMLKQASATGGMRTGQANVAGMRIAPELMMRGMQDAFGRNQAMATMGANAAGQTAGIAPQVGQSIGDINAQATANQGNIYGRMAGEMGAYLQKQLPTFGKSGSYI